MLRTVPAYRLATSCVNVFLIFKIREENLPFVKTTVANDHIRDVFFFSIRSSSTFFFFARLVSVSYNQILKIEIDFV